MDKEDQLLRLLRLKRYEQPPEEFAKEFLEEFQRRQRTDIVRRSALSIVWERLTAWFEGLRRPAVLWTAGLAYAALMLALWLLPRHTPGNDMTMIVGTGGVQTHAQPQVPEAKTQNVSTAPAPGVLVSPGGKRRTAPQPQEKENIIGTGQKTDEYQPPPLSEL